MTIENNAGRPQKDADEKVSQNEANNNWRKKNKEYTKYLNYRSTARSFIRNLATSDDLDELQNLIDERRETI
ncbi:hypothetical protein H9L19_06420 [Weissella diestrammenae]|uniref:Uncharacterized protein n=1 Tax=Weissella diestrammenae TaxID=1162633 RepID=A0A7G9T4J1_9LACO|nr:hypothetical protein [Weissella diestrammenae]QNN75016.1 hypothetical protein H9L19_06420 [Weissella diestrammenae]